MAWEPFQWGSRGLWYKTPEEGIYMAHIFIPRGVRVVVRATGPSAQRYLHVFGVLVPTDNPGYDDCVAINTAFYNWVANDYRPMFASGVFVRDVVSTGMNSVPAAQATLPIALAGTRAGISLPGSVTMAVKSATHLSGRRNRGYKSVWPAVITDLSATQDRFQGAYVDAVVGVFNSLIARVNAAGYTLGIPSLTDAAIKPVATFVAVDDVLDARRRRLLGRGT